MILKSTSGFTLIELSIALVIIGLIVGGVLVGKDLIEAAQIRKTGQLIESMNTATYTFKMKYNGLPGDLAAATSFGLGVDGNGNGNITSTTGAPWNQPNSGIENSSYFAHLIAAQLVANDRPCGSCIPANAMYCMNTFGYNTPYKINRTSPISCGSKGYLGLTYSGGMNTAASTWQQPAFNSFANHLYVFSVDLGNGNSASISPATLSQFDSKFDDGMPNSGTIRAWGLQGNETAGYFMNQASLGSGISNCTITTSSPHVYNATNTNTDCPFFWKASF